MSNADMSIITKLFQHAYATPDKIAIYEREVPHTYKELSMDVKRLAINLTHNKVTKGKSVIVVCSNTYSFICLYFAIHSLGAKTINIPSDGNDGFIEFVSKKVDPILFIKDSQEFFNNSQQFDVKTFNLNCEVSDDSVADMVFTSGTTGEPKGVTLTHSQLTVATQHIIHQVKNNPDDIELLLMPLSHSFGMGRMRSMIYVGATLILGYPLQRLKSIFNAIKQHKVTGLGLVPSAWLFITRMTKNHIAQFADQLNYIEFGSAHLSVEEKAKLTEWFPSTHIVMHYGLTEVSRALFTDFHSDKHEAVGHIARGADIAILRDDEELADSGEIGEIALRAQWMFSGYHQNPELTKESFANGFFKTGDLGRLEGEYLFLTGRLKEVINVGGKKVSPQQIEDVLVSNKYVKECACAAYPDENAGEVVQAFIVTDENAVIDHQRLIEILKLTVNVLPVHMRPQRYQFISNIPKTSSGKVQRLKLTTLKK